MQEQSTRPRCGGRAAVNGCPLAAAAVLRGRGPALPAAGEGRAEPPGSVEQADRAGRRLAGSRPSRKSSEPDTAGGTGSAAAHRGPPAGDGRLTAAAHEERARAVQGRADQLRRAARQEREARARAEAARKRGAGRAHHPSGDRRVRDRAGTGGGVVAGRQRGTDRAVALQAEHEQALAGVHQGRELTAELKLTDAVHRDEVVRAEQRLRIERWRPRSSRSSASAWTTWSPSTVRTCRCRRARPRWPSTRPPENAVSR